LLRRVHTESGDFLVGRNSSANERAFCVPEEWTRNVEISLTMCSFCQGVIAVISGFMRRAWPKKGVLTSAQAHVHNSKRPTRLITIVMSSLESYCFYADFYSGVN
jgi:hypothetical protein